MNSASGGTDNPLIWKDVRRRRENHSGMDGSSSDHLKSTDRNCSEIGMQRDCEVLSTDSEEQKPAAQGRTTRSRNGIAKPKLEVNQLSLHGTAAK